MPVRPIVEVPDPRLRQVSESVVAVDDEVRALAQDMLDSMYAAQGIGLAAIQIGEPRRVVVLDLQEPEKEDGEPVKRPQVLVNPEIVWASDEFASYNEGCLSIPEQYAEVERPARVRAHWLDGEGQPHEAELDGLMATVVQHEIDHCNGVLFTDHISRLKREMLMKKLNKLRRAA